MKREIKKVLLKSTPDKKQSSFHTIIEEEIYSFNGRAIKNYKPRIYSGDLITLWASKDERFSSLTESCWSDIVTGIVKGYEFPRKRIGEVISGPYCKNVVEILRACLDEAQHDFSKKNSLESDKSINKFEHKVSQQSRDNKALWSSLIPIQPKGSRPPMFCIHAAEVTFTGEIHYAYDLARFLGPEQPIYGLQAQGLDGITKPHARIEEMAAYYIKEIKTVQHDGTYFLGGLGFGGLVALEMAQQLNTVGHKVSLLALFDSFRVSDFSRPPGINSNNYGRFTRYINIGKKIMKYKTKIKNRFLSEVSLCIKYPLPNLLTYFHLRQTFLRARKNYIPKIYEGKVILFGINNKSIKMYQGISLNKLVKGEIEIHDPDAQEYKDSETHMKAIAHKLKKSIDNA